jgi:16S rRNA (uracil1498-N3)-methyltransferase
VPRRLHVPLISVGKLTLDHGQSRHARDVLRLSDGDAVELFDDAGASADARIAGGNGDRVIVDVATIRHSKIAHGGLTVASAVPKGERADWMVEKLSEIGVDCFIPLATERSVVLPKGKSKHERWERLAIESAKQSRRAGVMKINQLTAVENIAAPGALFLTTEPEAQSILEIKTSTHRITLLIGPEGGWSANELKRFREAGLTGVKLTATILRIETAAICAAAVVATLLAKN